MYEVLEQDGKWLVMKRKGTNKLASYNDQSLLP